MRVGAGRAEAGVGQGMRAGERWLFCVFFFPRKEEDLHYFCIREWGLMPAEDDFSEC